MQPIEVTVSTLFVKLLTAKQITLISFVLHYFKLMKRRITISDSSKLEVVVSYLGTMLYRS